MDFSTDQIDEPRKVIEVKIPSSRPLWQKILFFSVLLAIVALLIFVATSLLKSKESPGTKKEETNSEKKVSTQSSKTATGTRCKPKQDLDNLLQGYQACFEAGWQQKEIKVSGLEIGLFTGDPQPNFPGNININITDQSEELVTQDASNNSSKFEFGKVNVDGKKSSQVVVTRQRDDPLIAYPKAIITATSQNNRTYVFTLNSTEENFAADTVIYEDFLETVEFLDEVAKPPWSESRNIIINQPWPETSIKSPATITGEALSFESIISIRIKDKNGKTLTETTAKTQTGTERSSFVANVSFDKGSAVEGSIEVYNASAQNGSEQDKVTIPVKFQ